MKLILIALAATILMASADAPRTPSTILYTTKPGEEGAFTAFDVLLNLDTLQYTTPMDDGYGKFRFEGTKVCFFASYSDTERCIDFLNPYTKWKVGNSWPIKSFDGSDAVIEIKEINYPSQ